MFGRRRPRVEAPDPAAQGSPDDDLAGHRPTGPMPVESARRLQRGITDYSTWTQAWTEVKG